MGTTKLIQSDTQYYVDSEKNPDLQLVCKYFKAYETGGRKGIDKLYKEGTIHIFPNNVIEFVCHLTKCYLISGNRRSKPVKFSTKPDLPSDVCEHLMAKYVPAFIRNTKILQQLFLRYLLSRTYMNIYGVFIDSVVVVCC